jgi:hypothetical protein
MQSVHSTAYDLGYFFGSMWPILLACLLVVAFRGDIIKMLSMFTHAISAFSLLVKEKKSQLKPEEITPVYPAVFADIDWDQYESPSYIRKSICLSF